MRNKRITYGVPGMMTYQAVLMAGRTKIKVLFQDGSMTASGRRPATFTTDNFMLQQIIENSNEFKKGKIFRYRVLILDGNVEIEKNKPSDICPPHHHHHHHSSDEGCGGSFDVEVPEESGNVENEVETEPKPEKEIEDESDPAIEQESEVAAESEEIPGLEFSSNDDAKDYLAEHFDVSGIKLHTRKDIIAAGESFGVEIKFK